MNRTKIIGLSIMSIALAAPGFALADETNPSQVTATLVADDDNDDEEEYSENTGKKLDIADPDPNKSYRVGAGEDPDALPPARSDHDPQPQVASPSVPSGGVIEQAGTGGQTAYGRVGVLELGGSASFTKANDFTQIALNPSIGWFFMDNIEISAILGLSHLNAQGVDTTFVNFLLEPSLHIPFSNTVFGLIGAGVGPSYSEDTGMGLAFAPRLGLQVLVGRSGILTPSIFASYSTHEAILTQQGALLAVSLTYGAGIGYTVMW